MDFFFHMEGHLKFQMDPREVIGSQNVKGKYLKGWVGRVISPANLPREGYRYFPEQHINELVHRERTSNPKAYCKGTSIKSNTTRVTFKLKRQFALCFQRR